LFAAPAVPVVVDNGLDAAGIPARPVILSWTPPAAAWAAVLAVPEVKHLVVTGRRSTVAFLPLLTGPYWSDAFDFTILPEVAA